MDRDQSREIPSRLLCSVKSHDQREDDGAVRFDDIMGEFKTKFDGTSQWTINDRISFLAKCKSGKRRKTGAKCAVDKDENCFLSDPT